jgi:hypothetical protein
MTAPREIDFEDSMRRNKMSVDEMRFALEMAEASGKVFLRFDPVTRTLKYFWIEEETE